MTENYKKRKLLIFASGSKDGGGSGPGELAENSITGVLNAEIVAVVSNHENGGVRKIADKYGIKFLLFRGPYDAGEYQRIARETSAEFIALSGWLKMVFGLDSTKTINIHPGPLPEFGGSGMYGHHVHEAVIEAYKEGKIKKSAVSMHFIVDDKKYDTGPVFFEYPVLIRDDDTPESLAIRVNKIEHGWQSYITDLIMRGEIRWDGKNFDSLSVPAWYKFNKNYIKRR